MDKGVDLTPNAINDYIEKDKRYNKTLENLVDCIENIKLSTSQLSLNLARIRLWLEIDSAGNVFDEFRDIDFDIQYAFACNIDFRKWVLKFNQISIDMASGNDAESLKESHDSDTISANLKSFVSSIKYYNEIEEADEENDNQKLLSEKFIASIEQFTNVMDSYTINHALSIMLWQFSKFLDEIHRRIIHPPLESLNSLYCFFYEDSDDSLGHELHSFVENNCEKPDFIILIKNRMISFFNEYIKQYCDDIKTWHSLFDWKDGVCLASYLRFGDFIWRFREKENKIEIASEIVSFSRLWVHYISIIEAYLISNGEKVGAKDVAEMIEKDSIAEMSTVNWDAKRPESIELIYKDIQDAMEIAMEKRTETQKKTVGQTQGMRQAIIDYVNKLLPVVNMKYCDCYSKIWLEILAQDSVNSIVYNRGRQKGTIFNRNLVAHIINMLRTEDVIKKVSDTEMAELLEPEKGKKHPVRGQLTFLPDDPKIRKDVKQVLERYCVKVS